MSNTADRIFKLYQRYEPLKLGEGEDAIEVWIWKPSHEEARQGQMYLLDRVGYWEHESTQVSERVESFLNSLPDDKTQIIQRILDETVAQKFAENADLIDGPARDMLENEFLQSIDIQDIKALWGLRPGSEDAFVATRRTQSTGLTRDKVLPFIEKKDEFTASLDQRLAGEAEKRFREEERAKYAKSTMNDLRQAIGMVNKRSIAMGLAIQDWQKYLLADVTREPREDKSKGAKIFSNNPKSPNFIGNCDDVVIMKMMTKLQTMMETARTDAIREVVDNGGFTNSAPSLSDSTNPRPVVVVPAMSQSTPST